MIFTRSDSLLGRMRSLLYRAPELKVTFELMEGHKRTFRAVKPIVEGGVLVNKFVHSSRDARAFFRGQIGRLRGVKSITLHSANSHHFAEDFEYVEESLSLSAGSSDGEKGR